MNHLAHSYLSFTDEQIVGNMIADYIKNADRKKLPFSIQQGINIHHRIDSFTDQHPIIHRAKKVFQPLVRLYAGVFVDVIMDYYLANDAHIYKEEDWKKHCLYVYTTLWKYENYLPDSFRQLLPKMETDDWLFNSRYEWAIKHSLQHLLNRAQYLEKDLPVFTVFLKYKKFLQECYAAFFPELKAYAESILYLK
ncbi:DUF479 domain-containing protein [Elizabethkingia argentiflava]|uniref:DUF479 domain-containing protein n=1 Tax=Elizabethkingia argenteiflava TaxID=2681556 RepID=A0A845PWE1_9FLAO|nr:ACP phosphodiesterase [Elizabethkingia argenteiflava]NAW51945.1 DUF479 domain-containing protein [Elizabethkingia argenteiflava]